MTIAKNHAEGTAVGRPECSQPYALAVPHGNNMGPPIQIHIDTAEHTLVVTIISAGRVIVAANVFFTDTTRGCKKAPFAICGSIFPAKLKTSNSGMWRIEISDIKSGVSISSSDVSLVVMEKFIEKSLTASASTSSTRVCGSTTNGLNTWAATVTGMVTARLPKRCRSPTEFLVMTESPQKAPADGSPHEWAAILQGEDSRYGVSHWYIRSRSAT